MLSGPARRILPSTRRALIYSLHGFNTNVSSRAFATSTQCLTDKAKPYTPLYDSENKLVFDSHAFKRWPARIILRDYLSFLLCQFPPLVSLAPAIMRFGNHPNNPLRVPFRFIMRPTIYDQFVGGDTDEEIYKTCSRLGRYGIEPMLAVPIETETIRPGQDISEWHNDNTEKLVDCIEKGKKFALKHKPAVHIKLTGIMDDDMFLKISEHIGLDLTCNKPDQNGRSSQNRFEDCVQDLMDLMQNPDHPCDYFLTFMTPDELAHVKSGARRLGRIGAAIGRTGVETLVDAEYINLNPTITVMTLALARIYNTETVPLVGNTYQCYLKNASKLVDYEIDYLKRHKAAWCAKMVRGAYMVSEAKRAKEGGYENPVCNSKDATHDNYNGIVNGLVDRIAAGEHIRFLAASHNEDTILMLVDRLTQLEAEGHEIGDKIIFAQLYGMCGHISSGLAMHGAPVYKALPIGGITDVLPYLARRAQENKTVLTETHRERSLLWEALMRRARGSR